MDGGQLEFCVHDFEEGADPCVEWECCMLFIIFKNDTSN